VVAAPRVRAETVCVGGRIPITAKMRVLGLADRVSARRRVDGGAPAAAGVVIPEAYIESTSILKQQIS
jgi:hypothetical protein